MSPRWRLATTLTLRCAAVVSLLVGSASSGDAPSVREALEAQLKTSIRTLLEHGDLADLDFVSRTFDLGLRVIPSDPASRHELSTLATRNPEYLLASGLSYSAHVFGQQQQLAVTFSFRTMTCPPLEQWGKEWGLPVEWDLGPHVPVFFHRLQWPGPDGIQLGTAAYRGGCEVTLHQQTAGPASLPTQHSTPPAARLPLQDLIGLLTVDDLRDYTRVANVLHAQMTPAASALDNGLLYDGSIWLVQTIPGVDGGRFSYYANDTGWAPPSRYDAEPRPLVERTVDIDFVMDMSAACIAPANLQSAVRRKLPRIQVSQRALETTIYRRYTTEAIFTSSKDNLTTMTALFEGDCLSELSFHQITDPAHGYTPPGRVRVVDAWDEPTDTLTRTALNLVDVVTERLAALPPENFKEIVIKAFPATDATAAERTSASRVQELLRSAFLDRTFAPEKIRLETVSREDTDPPPTAAQTHVTVEAWRR